jgi:hypothetical protein
VYERGDWVDLVQQAIERQAALLEGAPTAVPAMLLVHLLSANGADLLLPAGGGRFAGARARFAPLVTWVSAPPGAVPLSVGRDAGHAYLCRHGSCQLPAATHDELCSQMDLLHSRKDQT